MRKLAVGLVLVMVLAVAASAQGRGRLGQFGQQGRRGPRPFMVLGMKGFAVSSDAYELLGLHIVGPPKRPLDEDASSDETSDDETNATEGKRPPLRGVLHIAGNAYALKDVEVTFEDFEVETPEGETISGKRPSAFSATLCNMPDRKSLAEQESSDEDSEESSEPNLEEVGTLSLTIEAKEIAMMQRPAAKGEATIDGTSWTIYGAVDGPRPPRRPRRNEEINDEDDVNSEDDDSETADAVEEGF